MKKRWLKVIIYILSCIIFVGCSSDKLSKIDDKIEIVISASGSVETYHFIILKDSGEMLIKHSLNYKVDLAKKNIMISGRRYNYKYEILKEKVYLKNYEISEITDLLDLIYEDETSEYLGEVADSWGISIRYDGEVLKNNSVGRSPQLMELIHMLDQKTTIKIKLNGFA